MPQLIEQIINQSKVWYLDDFWHVHLNTKVDVLTDGKYIDELARISSSNKLPIRFTTARGIAVWYHHGTISSPVEMAVYSNLNGVTSSQFSDFDPSTGLISSSVDTTSGRYKTEWDTSRLGNDQHTHLEASPNTTTFPWDSDTGLTKLQERMGMTAHETGWPILASSFTTNRPVRYIPFRETLYMHTDKLGVVKYHRSGPGATYIRDDGVFEYGEILPSYKLQLTRTVITRSYRWAVSGHAADPPWHDRGVPTDLHRLDGPARIDIGYVKEHIGDTVRTRHHGSYYHAWFRGGRSISATRIQKAVAQHGIVLREGALYEQSAILNDVDLAVWAALPI